MRAMYSVARIPAQQTSTVAIRPYESRDNQRLSALWLEASLISHTFLPESLLLTQQKLVAEKYLAETETWVAIADDLPVGFIGLMDQFIGGLFVAPEAQGMGIGGELLRHAFELKGHLALEVYAANHRAVAFYRRHGFCGVRRRETDDNGLPHPLILMQKPCPSGRKTTPAPSA